MKTVSLEPQMTHDDSSQSTNIVIRRLQKVFRIYGMYQFHKLKNYCIFAAVLVILGPSAWGQGIASENISVSELSERLDSQAAIIAELQAELGKLKGQSSATKATFSDTAKSTTIFGVSTTDICGEAATNKTKIPVVVEQMTTKSCGEETAPKSLTLNYIADYDKGFRIKPVNPKTHPFQLKVNGWIQFRHVAFAKDRDSWTDNTGTTRAIRNRNVFDIERARLVFSGYAQDPRLTYFLQLDGDTDGRHAVDFFDYWWAWKFDDALRIQVGKRKAPGSRQWLLGARDTRFSERPAATDFFRPDRTLGIWATGTPAEGVFYELMFGNGYRVANRIASEMNNKYAVSGTTWWEPNGEFGKALTDHACSDEPLYRFGHSFTWAAQQGLNAFGIPFRETDFVRLTDGTRLVQNGALTAGTTVSEFDVYLYAVDAAMKYQGWSINSEFYFRWLQDLQGNGPVSRNKIAQNGFFVEGGRVIVPKKLDWNARYSQISGPFGNTSEYGAAFNWYPLDTQKVKLTFDVSQIDGSPLNATPTEYLVGDSGTLFRTQFQAEF